MVKRTTVITPIVVAVKQRSTSSRLWVFHRVRTTVQSLTHDEVHSPWATARAQKFEAFLNKTTRFKAAMWGLLMVVVLPTLFGIGFVLIPQGRPKLGELVPPQCGITDDDAAAANVTRVVLSGIEVWDHLPWLLAAFVYQAAIGQPVIARGFAIVSGNASFNSLKTLAVAGTAGLVSMIGGVLCLSAGFGIFPLPMGELVALVLFECTALPAFFFSMSPEARRSQKSIRQFMLTVESLLIHAGFLTCCAAFRAGFLRLCGWQRVVYTCLLPALKEVCKTAIEQRTAHYVKAGHVSDFSNRTLWCFTIEVMHGIHSMLLFGTPGSAASCAVVIVFDIAGNSYFLARMLLPELVCFNSSADDDENNNQDEEDDDQGDFCRQHTTRGLAKYILKMNREVREDNNSRERLDGIVVPTTGATPSRLQKSASFKTTMCRLKNADLLRRHKLYCCEMLCLEELPEILCPFVSIFVFTTLFNAGDNREAFYGFRTGECDPGQMIKVMAIDVFLECVVFFACAATVRRKLDCDLTEVCVFLLWEFGGFFCFCSAFNICAALAFQLVWTGSDNFEMTFDWL